MELELSTVNLRNLLEGSLSMFQEKAFKHDLHLTMNLPAECELELDADERKIKQVMFNLLSNAIKFSPDGGSVLVTVQMAPLSNLLAVRSYINGNRQSDESDFIEICVKDSGIGISREDYSKTFQGIHPGRLFLHQKIRRYRTWPGSYQTDGRAPWRPYGCGKRNKQRKRVFLCHSGEALGQDS